LTIADFNGIENGSAAGSRVSRPDGASSEGSSGLIIEHGGDRFAVIITAWGRGMPRAQKQASP
jgi:hypothetical protein